MALDLGNSVAVLTGAGSGIGRATALAFARRGAKVVVTDLDDDRASAVAKEIGDAAIAVRCDVTNVEDLIAAREVALATFGRIDLVMNNVGVLAVGPVEAIPLEGWERVVDINLMSVVRSLTVFLPSLLEQGCGHIVKHRVHRRTFSRTATTGFRTRRPSTRSSGCPRRWRSRCDRAGSECRASVRQA